MLMVHRSSSLRLRRQWDETKLVLDSLTPVWHAPRILGARKASFALRALRGRLRYFEALQILKDIE